MKLATIFCIDGSGNKDPREAEKKRPIYKLKVDSGNISRVFLSKNQSVVDFFTEQINGQSDNDSVLIAADLPLGLPEEPCDVYRQVGVHSFLGWLSITQLRLEKENIGWRDGLFAKSAELRTALQPFMSFKKDSTLVHLAGQRLCDQRANGESLYWVDFSPKQVGKAALQFWFEVLIPLQHQFGESMAVWPFQSTEGKRAIIAECYPAQCQRMVFGEMMRKRDKQAVSRALIGLVEDTKRSQGIDTKTWLQAAASEDDFDMFTTAFAFREIINRNEDLLQHPEIQQCITIEGWMLGLVESEEVRKPSRTKGTRRKKKSGESNSKVLPGTKNRNEQEYVGVSPIIGPKGPMRLMKCFRSENGVVCGAEYETNPQDVHHKKCPKCQVKAKK